MNTEIKPKLLVIEDDAENQKFLELFLKRTFTIDMCDSGEAFYKLINVNKYDLMLMDISLRGDKNGLDLIREIREMPDLKDTPILCLSAHAFNKDRESAMKAGADVFLTKPVENKVLLSSLLNLLNKNKKEQVS